MVTVDSVDKVDAKLAQWNFLDFGAFSTGNVTAATTFDDDDSGLGVFTATQAQVGKRRSLCTALPPFCPSDC